MRAAALDGGPCCPVSYGRNQGQPPASNHLVSRCNLESPHTLSSDERESGDKEEKWRPHPRASANEFFSHTHSSESAQDTLLPSPVPLMGSVVAFHHSSQFAWRGHSLQEHGRGLMGGWPADSLRGSRVLNRKNQRRATSLIKILPGCRRENRKTS